MEQSLQGVTSHDFFAHPLKVLIYERANGQTIFESRPFDQQELVEQNFESKQVWVVIEVMQLFANTIEQGIPTNERDVVRMVFENTLTGKEVRRNQGIFKFGTEHAPSLSGRGSVGLVSTQRIQPMIQKIQELNENIVDSFIINMEGELNGFKNRIQVKDKDNLPQVFEKIREETNSRFDQSLEEIIKNYIISLTGMGSSDNLSH